MMVNNNSGYDFFISFSNKDNTDENPIVSKVVDIIQDNYHANCWFQKKDSKGNFAGAIVDGIEKSRVFLVFVSENSANAQMVLNEVHHAVNWKNTHEDYRILPIVIEKDDIDISDPVYRDMMFYLGRLNMLSLRDYSNLEELVLKIFEQVGFEIDEENIQASLYHFSEEENHRLLSQNKLFLGISKAFFDKYVQESSVVLDVGCAKGDNILLNLEGCKYKKLLGVDMDQNKIDLANRTHGSEKNKFICCDVISNDFETLLSDYLKEEQISGFDVIYISMMLMHLGEPVKFLCVLQKYLKEDGVLFIQEMDDGASIVYRNTPFFDYAFRLWDDCRDAGDRRCARKIPSYIHEAGYSYISLEKCGISSLGLNEEMREVLWDIYFNYHLWNGLEDMSLFRHADEAKRILDMYISQYDGEKQLYDEGKTFVQLGMFFFVAKR